MNNAQFIYWQAIFFVHTIQYGLSGTDDLKNRLNDTKTFNTAKQELLDFIHNNKKEIQKEYSVRVLEEYD